MGLTARWMIRTVRAATTARKISHAHHGIRQAIAGFTTAIRLHLAVWAMLTSLPARVRLDGDPSLWEDLASTSARLPEPTTSAVDQRRPPDVAFFAAGRPAPQGSKRAFRNKHSDRIQQVESSKRAPVWRQDIRAAADAAMTGREPLDGPLEVELRFVFARPQSHFSTKGGLRPSAPQHMASGPDVDKLARGVLDALQLATGGCVIRDDRLVARLVAEKHWGERPGCHVGVRRLA